VTDRDPNDYLIFGPGPGPSPHGCKGADMAMVALQEMLKPILALQNLRLAAGPSAEEPDPLGRRQKFLVRFDPPKNN